MKKIWVTLVATLLWVSVVQAGLLPVSSYYNGQNEQTFDLGTDGKLTILLEFSVYKGTEAETMQEWTDYAGEAKEYVYAYQVTSGASSTADLTFFALTGINPEAIASATEDIGQAESVGSFNSGGVEPKADGYFNASVTKAIWEFDDGALIQGDKSWFLFLYSDFDWIKGGMAVKAAADDIPVPDVPEPATLALLAIGSVLLLRRKSK
jgi:hypothetical protein